MSDITPSLNRFHGGKVFDTARKLNVPPEEIVDFSASINPLGPPPGLKEYLFERFERVVHYPEIGAGSLARAFEDRWGLAEGSVLVGNGSTSFIYLLPAALGPGPQRIAAPAFGEYENAGLLAGCPIEYVTPDTGPPWSYSASTLLETIRPGARTVWIANPANPTGQLIPKDLLLEMARRVEGSDRFIILDEAFIEFASEHSLVVEAPRFRNLMVLRSLTKMYALPGLRLGWMVAHPDRIRELGPRLEPWAVNVLAHEAGFYCLGQDAYVRETNALIERERKALLEEFETMDSVTAYPSAANYLLVRIERPDWDAPRLADTLALRKLLIRDCSSFRNVGGRFFRMAVRTRDQNRLLMDALKELL
ncbi:MAG: threonine-phosphate decarboxylase [Deltaproteobacteria bacterium]|nr:threonine-phosphate decarboxylase [Deltaproteobacteria bacterium]